MKIRTVTIALTAALLTLGLTACDGDDAADTTDVTTSGVATAALVEDATDAPAAEDASEAPAADDTDTVTDEAILAQEAISTEAAATTNGRWGRGGQGTATSEATPAPVIDATAELTDAEIDGLILMREEEKLAHDVYVTLFDLWGLPVFENIAASETTHTEAVRDLLVAYGIDDPVTDDTIGVFTDPALDALYDDLVEQGSASLADALTVGLIIEDLDIFDLQNLLDETDNPDIERVYTSLLMGSENHMRAFMRQLDSQGGTYEANFLEQSEIDEILASGQQGGWGRDNH